MQHVGEGHKAQRRSRGESAESTEKRSKRERESRTASTLGEAPRRRGEGGTEQGGDVDLNPNPCWPDGSGKRTPISLSHGRGRREGRE